MRKIELSQDQLGQVVAMRDAGGTWLAIEKKTGIDRRVAKRSYEERQKQGVSPLLDTARKDYAEKAFVEHIRLLSAMAECLVGCLRPPDDLEIDMSAQERLGGLFDRAGSEETKSPPDEAANTLLMARRRRRNQRLLQALQEHTRFSVPWARIDEWKESWDRIREFLPEFRDVVRKAIASNIDSFPFPVNTVGKSNPASNSLSIMVISGNVSQYFLRELLLAAVGQKGEAFPLQLIWNVEECAKAAVSLTSGVLELLAGDTNAARSAAEKITKIVESNKVFKKLQDELNKLVSVCTEFEDALDPMVLKPIMIKTECRLCPL